MYNDYNCCICGGPSVVEVECIRKAGYCLRDYRIAYAKFYSTTSVDWWILSKGEVDLNDSGNSTSAAIDSSRYTTCDDSRRATVRNSWSDIRTADTKILRKKKENRS